MADLLDFLPLYAETADTIRARMDADANAGLDTSDPRWIDTREGTFYWDATQPFVLEMARLWDALGSEVVAAAFPIFAWGTYLDAHAETFGLARKDATPAIGDVRFVGTPGGLVATSTIVSADAATENGDAVEFQTTASGNIDAGLPEPVVTAAPSASGGALPAGTYFYVVTVVNAAGESGGSAEVSVTVTGTTSQVHLDWATGAPTVGVTAFNIYRSTVAGDETFLKSVAAGVTNADDTGSVTPTPGLTPTGDNQTASVTLPVSAVVPGTDGNVGAGAVINLDSPNASVASVTNPNPMLGGTEVETDDALRDRILFEFQGQGAGNANDYKRWALSRPGVGRVDVIANWNGADTVQVVLMTPTGDPVSSAVVTDVQNYLDPVAGQGKGQAPVGAEVTVTTPTTLNVIIAATVQHKSGYSLDGSGGTIATSASITAAIRDYINALAVGEDVIYDHVKAQVYRVEGVYKVTVLSVNSGTADIVVTTGPPQVATLSTVSLTAG